MDSSGKSTSAISSGRVGPAVEPSAPGSTVAVDVCAAAPPAAAATSTPARHQVTGYALVIASPLLHPRGLLATDYGRHWEEPLRSAARAAVVVEEGEIPLAKFHHR